MIDFRHKTFLHLCRIKNYTRTAKKLHMTQPAVSQQIKYLEEIYGGKLFNYNGKTLTITGKGKKLYEYTQRMVADSRQIKKIVKYDNKISTITFGATLSIGEFIMPDILSKIMKNRSDVHFNMLVENTETLLKKLQNAEINFALLEGFFDKAKYDYKTFSKEGFIGVCSSKSELKKGKFCLEELLEKQLILRESGSGTRDILEQILYEKNLSKNSFKSVIEIGNMSAIKELVAQDQGITFMYKAAAQKEISKGSLCEIDIIDFMLVREFNFVYLKNSIFEDKYLEWLTMFIDKSKLY